MQFQDMGRNRTKICPDCEEPVAASSLICVCGGSVVPIKSSSRPSTTQSSQSKRRRPERTTRGKPNFYDALEFDKQKKDKRKKAVRPGARPSEIVTRQPTPPPPHRMQLMRLASSAPDEPQVKEEELEEIVLSEEKIAKFSLILDEINRKICASSWQGVL